MHKNRKELEENLITSIDNIKHTKTKVNKIINGLKEYGITTGEVNKYLKFAEKELPELDLRVLCLLTDQVYIVTGDINIKTDEWFTETEIKQSKLYSAENETEYEDLINSDIVVDQVIMVDSENYIGKMHIKELKKYFDVKRIRYNFNYQREAKLVKRHGTIERTINLNMASVKEITEKALNNELEITTITLNAQLGTALGDEELIYDPRKMSLTITKQSYLDILDGMHRLTGVMNALEVNSDLDFSFQVSFKNFNEAQARRHLAQISKINPINTTHIKALEESRKSDLVVKHLQRESDLKGKISQTNRIHVIAGEIVSYSSLSDTVEEMFNMETKRDALEVSSYLTDYFDLLISAYREQLIDRVEEYREKSLINSNVMIGVGFVVLAKRLQDEGINYIKILDILDNIDFSRDNKLWYELGILDENKVITGKARKLVKDYFMKLPLEVGVK